MTIEQSTGWLMLTVEEFPARLAAGHPLFVAGAEELLRSLPKGDWIGGTSTYFIAERGGLHTREHLYVTEVPPFADDAEIKVYDAASIGNVYLDAPDNGYSLIVIPAASRTLQTFALNAPNFANFACRPLLGWVTGVELADVGRITPKVFDGRNGGAYEDAALVLHVTLPKTKTAEVGIINIFEPGDGDVLTFASDGFSAEEVLVDGKPTPLIRYLKERRLDTRLPLVADYNGVMINTSFLSVDEPSGKVRFCGPVFRGVRYRHARAVGDYVEAFSSQLPSGLESGVAYSCNCILNYMYAGLEGRRTSGFTGTMTFGEIAYQLLNQTLVYLKIADANLSERLRRETTLRKQFRVLESVTQGLAVFNSMVSHDLRAPLVNMRELSKRLQSSPAASSDAQGRDYAQRIVSSSERMMSLIDSLMSFSHADSANLIRVPVDLNELVAEVREELRADFAERDVVWAVEPLPTVRGDRLLLRQVIHNLLSNALKYTRARPQARVDIGAERGPEEIVVTVRDNGIGFEPQAAARLFKPFQRLHTAQEYPGSGIGLAIVGRIVTRHGGRVWADARPGHGASFSFSLPND